MHMLGMLEVEMDIEKLKRCKSTDCGQITAELIEGVCRTVCSEVDNLIEFICSKEEIPWQWKVSIIVPVFVLY